MRLLFDENLSRKLAPRFADLFPGSVHAATEGLLQSSDAAVWEYAKARDFAIVTADADFYELATTFGPPPKVIWLRGCDYPTAVARCTCTLSRVIDSTLSFRGQVPLASSLFPVPRV